VRIGIVISEVRLYNQSANENPEAIAMNRNAPSLFALFCRSRFCRSIPDDDDSVEARTERRERERFAVAALGFCLKHEPKFLNHFWRQICRVPSDPPNMPKIKPTGILLEPPHWADLRLIGENRNKRFVWVIEVKAGAPLDQKQRPDRPAIFMKKGSGYGALFKAAEAKVHTQMRYIILGANESDRWRIMPGTMRSGMAVQRRDWNDLASGLVRTVLVRDLCETLGELKINPFYMEKAKRIRITDGLSNAGKAWTVLHAVCKQLGIRESYRYFEGDTDENGGGSVGIYIKQPPKRKSPSDQHLRLRRLTTKKGWSLAWFGYEYSAPKTLWKSVYFYFDDPEQGQQLKRNLFPTGELKFDERALAVRTPSKEGTNDFDSFMSVFNRALMGITTQPPLSAAR
jgi:hypothetical protein